MFELWIGLESDYKVGVSKSSGPSEPFRAHVKLSHMIVE